MSGHISILVSLDIQGDVEVFANTFAEYLTTEGYPFEEDYGPNAWGGYDGPFVTGVIVSQNGLILKQTTFEKEDEEE